MGALAIFGIENDGLNLAVNLLILFLVVIWLALVYWTYADARRRIGDPLLVACATAASLFPFVGDRRLPDRAPAGVPRRRARARARDRRGRGAAGQHASDLSCQYCGFEVEKSFLRCPSCLRRLKEPCHTCGKPLDPRWKICPYCEAEVGPGAGRRPPAAPAAHGSCRGAAPLGRTACGHPARRPAARRPGHRRAPGPRRAPGAGGTRAPALGRLTRHSRKRSLRWTGP